MIERFLKHRGLSLKDPVKDPLKNFVKKNFAFIARSCAIRIHYAL